MSKLCFLKQFKGATMQFKKVQRYDRFDMKTKPLRILHWV